MEFTRRRILLSGSSIMMTGIAACLGTQRGATDIYIVNNASSNKSINLTVEKAESGEPVYQNTIGIQKAKKKKMNNKIAMGDDLLVILDTQDGLNDKYKWTNPNAPLSVKIKNNDIEFNVDK